MVATIQEVRAVRDRYKDVPWKLFPDVNGIGIGYNKDREASLRINVERHAEELRVVLTETLDGVPVTVVEVGEIRPLGGAA